MRTVASAVYAVQRYVEHVLGYSHPTLGLPCPSTARKRSASTRSVPEATASSSPVTSPTERSFVFSGIDPQALINRNRTQLRFGGHPNKAMQADWNVVGEEQFTFEIVDTLSPPADAPDRDLRDECRALEELWMEKLAPYEPDGLSPPSSHRSIARGKATITARSPAPTSHPSTRWRGRTAAASDRWSLIDIITC